MQSPTPSRGTRDRGEGETDKGVVVRLDAHHARVRLAGRTVRCSLRKSLFRKLEVLTQPLAVGEHVGGFFATNRNRIIQSEKRHTIGMKVKVVSGNKMLSER